VVHFFVSPPPPLLLLFVFSSLFSSWSFSANGGPGAPGFLNGPWIQEFIRYLVEIAPVQVLYDGHERGFGPYVALFDFSGQIIPFYFLKYSCIYEDFPNVNFVFGLTQDETLPRRLSWPSLREDTVKMRLVWAWWVVPDREFFLSLVPAPLWSLYFDDLFIRALRKFGDTGAEFFFVPSLVLRG